MSDIPPHTTSTSFHDEQQHKKSDENQNDEQQNQEQQRQEYPDERIGAISWPPMECDPGALQEALGCYGVSDVVVTEIYGEELFDMIPQPVEAVVILYPITDPLEHFISTRYPTAPPDVAIQHNVKHIRQTIRNACGSYALIHFAMNKRELGEFSEDSPLQQLSVCITPENNGADNGEIFESNAELFSGVHAHVALERAENQTDVENWTNTDVHYIVLFEKKGRLWLLDGRAQGPIDCGECTESEVLAKGWDVMMQMYAVHNKETDLAALALTKLQ